jgi:hypothetical protein
VIEKLRVRSKAERPLAQAVIRFIGERWRWHLRPLSRGERKLPGHRRSLRKVPLVLIWKKNREKVEQRPLARDSNKRREFGERRV